MKIPKLPKIILMALLAFNLNNLQGQNSEETDFEPDSLVYDSLEKPIYVYNDIIIKFHPGLVDTSVINDTLIQEGTIADFIHPIALQMIIDSGYFDSSFANLTIKKIHRKLTANITTTNTRMGETITMPAFWSTFLIKWDDNMSITFLDAIDSLNKMWPIIEYAEKNSIFLLHFSPDDPKLLSDQAGLLGNPGYDINMDPAWDLSVCDPSIRVGIFDTGINWDHEDLSTDGTGFWNKSVVKDGWDWINDRHPNFTSNNDELGHGSALAGIIGAITYNTKGIAGVAGGNASATPQPKVGISLIDLKLFNRFGQYAKVSLVTDAITEGASAITSTYGYGLHIMNFSFFLKEGDAISTKNAIRFAFNNKVVITGSSGNDGTSNPNYPNSFRDDWIIKVGANDNTGSRASFSVTGNHLDCIAPGVPGLVCGLQAFDDDDYNCSLTGTSYAAPTVAGVVGLMISYINNLPIKPNLLAPEDCEALIQLSCTDVDATGEDANTGFGRINAGATMESIVYPRYHVRHYLEYFGLDGGNKIHTDMLINLTDDINGLKAGFYYADVYEYNVTFKIDQAPGRTILAVWKRNSASNLYEYTPTLPIVHPEPNCEVISSNQTHATMRGYFYDVKSTIMGDQIKEGTTLPPGGFGQIGLMGLTVYSENVLDVPEIHSIDKDLVRIYPNPTNGSVQLKFALLKNTNLGIEVTDIMGKVVYIESQTFTPSGHQEINLDLANLSPGVYICNIITSEGIISKRISIVK